MPGKGVGQPIDQRRAGGEQRFGADAHGRARGVYVVHQQYRSVAHVFTDGDRALQILGAGGMVEPRLLAGVADLFSARACAQPRRRATSRESSSA